MQDNYLSEKLVLAGIKKRLKISVTDDLSATPVGCELSVDNTAGTIPFTLNATLDGDSLMMDEEFTLTNSTVICSIVATRD